MNAKYCDQNGYPGTIQADGTYDGGDTAAIIGTIGALSDLDTPAVPFAGDVPIRHPDQTKWYGQPDRFSRDQLVAVICGLIDYPNHKYTTLLYAAHKRRLFLTAWNTRGNGQMDMPNKFPDVCGPEVWALWLRLWKPRFRHLVLWLLDIQTLIGAVQWRWFTPESNQVTRNHMLVCLATIKDPSVTSRLACKINDWADLVSRWRACNTATGEYPTADLFQDKINGI